MIIVNYTSKGKPISDFDITSIVETTLKKVNTKEDIIISTSTESLVHAFLLEVIRHNIEEDKIKFFMDETKELTFDMVIGFDEPNLEFGVFTGIVEDILKAGYDNLMRKRKDERFS